MAIKVVQEYYLVVVICQSSHVQGRVDQVYYNSLHTVSILLLKSTDSEKNHNDFNLYRKDEKKFCSSCK